LIVLWVGSVALFMTFAFSSRMETIAASSDNMNTDAMLSEAKAQGGAIVGSFNLQIFGKTKMGKPQVVSELLRIVSMYDLLTVTEIRDSSESAFPDFMSQLNAQTNNQYSYLVGPRVGRSVSKEQYGVVYKTALFEIQNSYTFDDTANQFERPPLVVTVGLKGKKAGSSFGVITIHTKPSTETYKEIDALAAVQQQYSQWSGVQDVVIMGDYNGDCSYFPASRRSSVRLITDSRYSWLIGDEADTTSGPSDCAYDRIVITGSDLSSAYVVGSASPYNFQTAHGLTDEFTQQVSDHYPVLMQLRINSYSSSSFDPSSPSSPDTNSHSSTPPHIAAPVGAYVGIGVGVCVAGVMLIASVVNPSLRQKIRVAFVRNTAGSSVYQSA